MPATATSSALHRLADRVGIISEYLDQTGKDTRACSDETRVLLLSAMGIDASSDEAAERALEELEARAANALLSPVRVIQKQGSRPLEATFVIPPGLTGHVEWAAELRAEDGRRWRRYGETRGAAGRGAKRLAILLPRSLELGYHTLRVAIRSAERQAEASQSLIVVPSATPKVEEVLGDRSIYGIITNLYTLRSGRNWGAGDLTDLRDLVQWSASEGAGFVGVNPLHALLNRGVDVSPYSPVSRLFRNTLYIDVEAVPEFAESREARRLTTAPEFRAALARSRATERIDYGGVMDLKMPVLRALFRTFRERAADAPTRAFARYLESQGQALADFATWSAIAASLAAQVGPDEAYDWHHWPESYRDPRSPAVARFRQEQAEEIAFHSWLQWELDSQLESAAKLASEVGMPIGLYQDLAIGTSPTGSDSWAFPNLFLQGVSIGAPPDPYAAEGQNWGLPPLDPRRLKEDRYGYWIALVRSALRHAGALRLDHVMGLFRQFWIPEGRTGKEGAYVRFPSDDLLGILALESVRHRALVVGEDLGTVPPEVPPALKKWGILTSKVLYFEREGKHDFRPASSYDSRALATANTHDMPTIAGFRAGRDIDLKVEVGMMAADEADEARRARQREMEALIRRLTSAGVLASGGEPEDAELRGAVHEFLCRTPSALVGLMLDDVVGEREPVNIPGVAGDKFPSWTRRMRLGIEDLASDPGVAKAMRCAGRSLPIPGVARARQAP
jgi:4-alpha-glucanotransferase